MLAVEFVDDAVEGSLVNEWLGWVDRDKIDAILGGVVEEGR